MSQFSFSGQVSHSIAGGDGLFQRAAEILMGSDLDARTALRSAHAQMGLGHQIALTNAKSAPLQSVGDAGISRSSGNQLV